MKGAGAALLALEDGGRTRLQERLLFFPEGDDALARFRDEFEAAPKAPLADLCKRAGLRPAALVAAFRTAAEVFEREIAKVKALQALPDVIDNLRYHALDHEKKCPRCWIQGKTGLGKSVVVLGTDEAVCPECDGTGLTMQSSPYKPLAVDRLTEIGKLRGEKGPLVAIQQNTIAAGADFMERMAKAVAAATSGPVVEALPPGSE